jgi:hypothetical protein
MNWLEIAKNLPQGQHTRSDCPVCGEGTNTNAAIVNHNAKYYSIFCNACDHKDYESKGVVSLEERKRINDLNEEALRVVHTDIELPKDTTYEPEEFSREARMWLFKGGLTPTVWKKYGIGYSKRLERVVLPVYSISGSLIWYQCRAILEGQKPKYVQPARDKGNIYYASKGADTGKPVIVVEDILSYIRVTEATGEQYATFTPLGTKLSSGQANALSEYEGIITWLDNDRAGQTGARRMAQTMSLVNTVRNVRTEEDPKHYSTKQILEILT